MRNRILDIAHNIIPYVKELRPITGSVTACVLMQQLDHWFAQYPDGFYKFMAPCNAKKYREGDSWSEELGMSKDEFRGAFDKIGTRYSTKTSFVAASDKFQDKFYCSYHDKKEGLTWYFRNHELVDKMLDELVIIPPRQPFTGDGKSNLQGMANPISTNGDSQLHTSAKPISPISTKSTTESTSKTTTNNVAADEKLSLSEDEVVALVQQLVELRIEPSAAQYLASRFPDRCRHYIPLWHARGFEGVKTIGGAVRDSIENPDSHWAKMLNEPQLPLNGAASNGSTPKIKLPPDDVLEAAAAAAFESLTPADKHFIRGVMEMEKKSLRQAMEGQRNSEFHYALRALQKAVR